jgi:hypothetical protein
MNDISAGKYGIDDVSANRLSRIWSVSAGDVDDDRNENQNTYHDPSVLLYYFFRIPHDAFS